MPPGAVRPGRLSPCVDSVRRPCAGRDKQLFLEAPCFGAPHKCRDFTRLPPFVVPAQSGAQFHTQGFLKSTLLRSAASLPFFTRLRRASHLSLSGQRNMAQRKATPMQRSPGILPSDCATRLRRFTDSTSVCWQRTGPRPVGHPSDYSCATPPLQRGPIERASCAQEQKQDQEPTLIRPAGHLPPPFGGRKELKTSIVVGIGFFFASVCLLLSCLVTPLLRLCFVFAFSLLRRMRSEWGPYAAAKWRRKGPQGGSQGCEPVGCQSRDGLSANPRSRFAQSQGRSPETAASGWPFSWLLLFGHSKRSDSLAGRRVNTRQGCRAPQARAPRKTDITSPGGK